MFKFSLRQLFRRKGKALLFFLLLAASTALVVTGAVMTVESAERIATVESTYTTIGMVEQLPIDTEVRQSEDSCLGTQIWTRDIYADPIMMDALDFPGANYIVKPEQRPVFVSYQPDMRYSWGRALPRHLLEFTPLEYTDGTEPVEVKVTRVLHSEMGAGMSNRMGDGSKDKKMEVGDTFFLSQQHSRTKYPLEVGERYVSNISLMGMCQTHGRQEYYTYIQPHSNQSDTEGKKIDKGVFGDDPLNRIAHVTGDDFYEPGHMGDIYEKWVKIHEMENSLFPVLGTSSLTELPSYHDKTMRVTTGREITPEEFAEGALVCMLPEKTATGNRLSVGDKVKLPLTCAKYGGYRSLCYDFSLLNADGEFYDVFWEQEYEIVGLYTGEETLGEIEERDIYMDMFIIPINSVGASWENNIAEWNVPSKMQATFQIPNGTIAEFDEAFKANVPEAASLKITYDDRGYSEVMKSLRNSRDMAHLLLLGGILAALAIIAMLLYFFVVKEKKRTAIERSLGMSKKQCRVSLLGGLAVLTAVSVLAGAVLGTAALSMVREEPAPSGTAVEEPAPEELDARYRFSTKFSMWAAGRELAEDAVIEADAPMPVYIAMPIAMCLIVLLLAWLLLERSFKTDPIYLLSTRETK